MRSYMSSDVSAAIFVFHHGTGDLLSLRKMPSREYSPVGLVNVIGRETNSTALLWQSKSQKEANAPAHDEKKINPGEKYHASL